MQRIRKFLRTRSGQIIFGLIPVVAVALPFIYFFMDEFSYHMFGACFTKPQGKISNLAGYDFEISYTDCDYGFGAGDYYTTVVATRVGKTKKTILFKYQSRPNDVPEITAVGPHAVEISLPQTDDLYTARTHLDDLSVLYKIGIIGYVTSDELEQLILDKTKSN